MAAAQYLLGVAAALVFLLIGLEELPVRFNVARVARTVRRRARARARPVDEVLAATRRSTRQGAWILLAFALASAVAFGLRLAHAPPGSPAWPYEAPIHLFSAVLVAGLFFLAFAFGRWAPRLLDRVEESLGSEGSNPELRFLGPKAPPMVTIRDFRETDGDAVRAMMKSLASQRKESDHSLVLKDEYQRFFAGYMLGFLKNPDAVMKVAEDQGQVVGYVVATRGREASYLRYSHVAILSDVFVKESHRGKGLARQLIAAIEQWARDQKLQAIEVSVFPDHTQEMQSLEGLGFFQYRIKMLRPLDDPSSKP